MKETANLNLKKPDQNDFYNIDDFNNNSDIIDKEIGQIKEDMKNISTDAKGTSFDNSDNGMVATNVQDAIEENKATIEENKASIEENKKSIEANKTSILSLDVEVGDLTTLQTTDKTNLVSAINEVFQNADNGKTIIANAVGTPLSATDIFKVMGDKIDTLTQTFQNSLAEKGVEVLPSDKMSTLISKVSNILGIKGIIAGISTLEFEDEAEYTTKSSNFEVVKTITLNTRFPQEGRSISFDIRKTTTATTTAKAKFHIKRNGKVVFTSNEFTNSSSSPITCTTDVFIKTGDVIEFMINRASLTTSAECAIKNIKSTYEYVF